MAGQPTSPASMVRMWSRGPTTSDTKPALGELWLVSRESGATHCGGVNGSPESGGWRKRPKLPAALMALACGVLAACGSTSTTEAQSHTHSSPQSRSVTRHGAPVAFAASRGIPLPPGASENTNLGGGQDGPPPVALAGDTVFVTTGTYVQVVSATTGRTIGSVKPQYTVPNPAGQDAGFAGYAAAPARVEKLQGRQVALVGYVVRLPGHGTTPPSLAVEVDAVDTSAQRLWQILAPLPGRQPILAGDPTVTFVGSSGSDVVAAVGDHDDGYITLAFDIAHRKLLWQSPSFRAETVVGNTAVGTLDTSAPSSLGTHSTFGPMYVSAVNLQDGRTGWQYSESVLAANIQQGGPDTVLVEAEDYGTGDDIISLFHVSTGKDQTLARQQGLGTGGTLPWTCQFDGLASVVCSDGDGGQVQQTFALDGSTGDELWQLPDKSENRIAPMVAAVYDGKVYGTTSSGPVVLDARTGKDVNDSPGIAPVVVDADVGIADSQGNGLVAYPATR
jgi:hypothetical protein